MREEDLEEETEIPGHPGRISGKNAHHSNPGGRWGLAQVVVASWEVAVGRERR